MDSHDIRNLQEAYLEVYQQELDEVLDTPTSRFSYAKKMLPSALRAFVTGDKKTLKKRSAGANRGMRKIEKSKEVKERVEIYELLLSHLLDEGYVNDLESAEIIMENMSEEWVYDILEGAINDLRRKHGLKPGDSIAQRISDRALKLSRQRKGQTPERKKKYEDLSTTVWRRANPLPTRHPSGRKNMDQDERDRRRESDVYYRALHGVPPSTKKHGRFTQGKGSLPKGKKLYQHVIRGMIPPEMSSKIDPFVLLQSAAGKKSNINAEFELWVNELINEGYDLSEHTLDDMYKLYEASGGVIGGRFFRKKKSSNPGQKKSKRIADAIGSAIDRVMGYDIKPNRGPIDIPPEVRERYMRNRKRR